GEKSLSVKDNKLELGGVKFGSLGNTSGFVSAAWNERTVTIRSETNSPSDLTCQNIVVGDKLGLDSDYAGVTDLIVTTTPSAVLDEFNPVFIDCSFNVNASSPYSDISISFELLKQIGSPSASSLLDPDGILPDVSIPGWPYYEVPLGVNILVGDTNVSIVPSWDRQIVSFDFTESGVIRLPLGGDIQDQDGNSLLVQGESSQGIQGIQGSQGLQGTTAGPTYQITVDPDGRQYLIQGFPNASLYLLKGFTYYFNVDAPGYPVFIKTNPTSGLDNIYANGVVNNGTDFGIIEFTIPLNAPDTLYYVNIIDPNMSGLLTLSETGLQGLPGESVQGIQGTTGPAGVDGISFVYMGAFDPDAVYSLNQVVFYEGSSYIFIANTPTNGQYPTFSDPPIINDLFWALLTSRGVQGIQGTSGQDGVDGIQGIQGRAGQNGGQGIQGTSGTSLIFRGEYNSTYPYYKNDVVYYQGSTYIYIFETQSIGQDPAYGDPPVTNFIYWSPSSGRGAQGLTGEQGIQGIQGIQGDTGLTGIGFNWTGPWENTTDYYPYDVVFYNGSAYISISQNINTDPEVTPGAWSIISQKGTTGEQGSRGIQGVQGIQGTVGQGFKITRLFNSFTDLIADNGTRMTPGEFALIDTGNVNDDDNAKLYVWNGTTYTYITDLSGATGIQGTDGAIGPPGPQG
ncbi:hypothetical protein EB118_22475, partial [bacterium]|nr:hypothetical protein [bacterium]